MLLPDERYAITPSIPAGASARLTTPCLASRSTTSASTLRPLWLLSLHARHSTARAHAIELFLLSRLHRSNVQNRDGISFVEARYDFGHIEIADAKSHYPRYVLAVVHDENHSATTARTTTELSGLSACTLRSLCGTALLASRLETLTGTSTSALTRTLSTTLTAACTIAASRTESAGSRNIGVDTG